MSWYTIFDQQEILLTSTTTSVSASTDALLIHNVGAAKKYQTTVGQVNALMNVSTSTSTATNLPPYGLSFLNPGTGGTTVAWLLTDPPVKGLVKTVWISSTTSTANTVATQGATIYTTANATAVSVTIQGSGAGGFQLVSLSTAQWFLLGSRGTVGTS